MLTSIKWTKDRHGCVTDPLSQPLAWHTLNELRFKPYGAVCVRTDGFMAEKEAGQIEVCAQPEKTQLTVVFLPATGTWLTNVYDKDRTAVLPEVAAEARNVSFAGDDCVFEKDAGCPEWSIVRKPAGSAVSDPPDGIATVVITPDKERRYVVKARCGTSSDTFEIVVWKMEFKEDKNTHQSIEGYDSIGKKHSGLLNKYGSYSRNTSFSDNHARLYFHMTTEGAAWVADRGSGSWLQPSGEIRYTVFINVGDAQGIALMITADWGADGTVKPVSPLIEGGAGPAICELKDKPAGYYSKVVNQGVVREIVTGPNPVRNDYVVSGKAKVGLVEAGVDYRDYGADPGDAAVEITVTYAVYK